MLSIYNAIFSDLFYYPKSRHRISNSGGTIRNSATQIWYWYTWTKHGDCLPAQDKLFQSGA